MQAERKETFDYGFKKNVEADFENAIERTKEALKTEGFGVLSEIRIDQN